MELPPSLLQFLQQNSSAVFGLAGALGGGLLSFIATSFHKRQDFDLQIWGKLYERRIAAHERVIKLAIEMRIMIVTGDIDETGELRRSPRALASKEDFEAWLIQFSQLTLEGATWLTTSAKRELNFVQDYLATLHMHLVSVPSQNYSSVGELIRQDFIDLSSSLEKKAYEFFIQDIKKLRLNSLNDWHKYQRKETEQRLETTALLSRIEEISQYRTQ